jgi:triacylglycerol lipase
MFAVALVSVGLASPAQAAPLPVPYGFLPQAVFGGAPNANAPGTNDWSCKPTAAHPRPVVLVHGTGGNQSTNWQTYGPLLKNNGYCVFALTYGTVGNTPFSYAVGGMAAMESSAQELAAFVAKVRQATGASKVDFIGHSQGTLMPQYYVRYLGGASSVFNYISLASLWHGTQTAAPASVFASLAGVPSDAIVPFCTACGQFPAGSAYMAKIRAGGTVATPGVRYTNIVTKYDELVVPYTSGIETGMTNIVLQDVCKTDYSDHAQLASSRTASQLVLNALDPAHATKPTCSLVLPAVGGV